MEIQFQRIAPHLAQHRLRIACLPCPEKHLFTKRERICFERKRSCYDTKGEKPNKKDWLDRPILEKSGRPGSNRRQPAWKAGTLPTELLPQRRHLHVTAWRCMISRDARIRTADLLVPNQARYQLRYTPLSWCLSLCIRCMRTIACLSNTVKPSYSPIRYSLITYLSLRVEIPAFKKEGMRGVPPVGFGPAGMKPLDMQIHSSFLFPPLTPPLEMDTLSSQTAQCVCITHISGDLSFCHAQNQLLLSH